MWEMVEPLRRETAEEHAAQMRERIMAGAERAFATSGFRGTSVPQIAAEARVSVGLIYRYFPSKEELFLAVCQATTETELTQLAGQLGQMLDPEERIEAVIGVFVQSLVEKEWGSIVIQALGEADRNPRLRDMLQRLFDQQRGFAAMLIREAMARGEMPPDTDVEALSLAAAMLLHGAIVHQEERGPAFDPEATARAIVALLRTPLRR